MPTEKVLVTRTKLDNLANTIASKASVSIPMTIDEMTSTVPCRKAWAWRK